MADIERGYPVGQARDSDDNLELQPLRSDSTTNDDREDETLDAYDEKPLSKSDSIFTNLRTSEQRFWDRLRGKGRRVPGWGESFKNILFSSWLNILLPVVPVAWVSHFIGQDWSPKITFRLCLWAIIPLAKLFDWGAEQMTLYLGKALGDLLTITMNNAVEAVLTIILLLKCELRLLQATIIGVMILHLLLVPGAAFLSGGAHIWEQELHPNATQLNHSLLALGVLAILLPTAFFASLDRGAQSLATNGVAQYSGELLTDNTRGNVLKMSRGLAVLLLIVYILSRVYLHNPPEVENENSTKAAMDATEEHKHQEHSLDEEDPKINPWACIILIVITVGIMAVTAEFLVSTIEGVRETTDIQEEWFGLILLPLVSFAPDGLIALVHSARKIISHMLGRKTIEPCPLAKALSIDLSIQFTLFWTPMLVLIGWWTGKPMHLLFDYFELAIILGSCFLVNYVTADLKTNWVEGLIMITFYVMIALCTWFYAGQPELEAMLTCAGSVAQALAEESGGEGGGEQSSETAELAKRALIAMIR